MRGAQWEKFLPQFFIPRFGGTEENLSNANHRVIDELMDDIEKRWEIQNRPEDFNEYWNVLMNEWVVHMFEYAGITLPYIDRIEFFKEVSQYVIPHVKSANEGVQETLKFLWEQEYSLYTSSGEVSWELERYIRGMGCEDYFHTDYYGPNLINEGKLSPKFFSKVFQEVGIDPSRAIVLDDNPYFLEYAKDTGAHIIQSHINVQKRKVADYIIQDFREIPSIIERIQNTVKKK